MTLGLGTAAILLVVLLWELARPTLERALERGRALWALHRRPSAPAGYDPGRERRAELRARALLRSCIDEHDWAMYRDLGFLRVWGGQGERGRSGHPSYAYLIYPHKPLVAYVPQTGALLNEYCVAFPDPTRPYGSSRLPGSDDVLAKWMALTADERRLIADANMHLPGRQVDPARVRGDLARLARWERERAARARHGTDRVEAADALSGPPRTGVPEGVDADCQLFAGDPPRSEERVCAHIRPDFDPRGADRADTLHA